MLLAFLAFCNVHEEYLVVYVSRFLVFLCMFLKRPCHGTSHRLAYNSDHHLTFKIKTYTRTELGPSLA